MYRYTVMEKKLITAIGTWNTLAVTDLTMLSRCRLWKHLKFGAGKTIECSEL